MTIGKGKLASYNDGSPCLHNAEKSVKPYTQKQKRSGSAGYTHISVHKHIYMCVFVAIILKEKETINLRGWVCDGLESRKDRVCDVIIFQLNHI